MDTKKQIEHRKEYMKKWYATHTEYHKEYMKKYRQEHKEFR